MYRLPTLQLLHTATEVLSKRKEYITIKKVSKAKGIHFQTLLTRMQVFMKEWTVTYHSAEQTAGDLHAKGLPVTNTRRTKETMDTLTQRQDELSTKHL